MAKALLFPSAVEALGNIGRRTSEVWWSPSHPFTSSLTGQTCQQFADAYESSTGKQWTQPLMHYEVFEVVVDALKRTKNVDDKQVIVDAIKATDIQTIAGHITLDGGPAAQPGRQRVRHGAHRGPVEQGHQVPVQHRRRQRRVGQEAAGRGHPDDGGSSRPSPTDPSLSKARPAAGARWRPSEVTWRGSPSGEARATWGGARRSAPPHVSPVRPVPRDRGAYARRTARARQARPAPPRHSAGSRRASKERLPQWNI